MTNKIRKAIHLSLAILTFSSQFAGVAHAAPAIKPVITTPADEANVTGTLTVTATSTDATVVGMTLLVGGVDVGTEDIASPYSFQLDTTVYTNSTRQLKVRSRNTAGDLVLSATNVTIHVTNPDVTPPNAAITDPIAGESVLGTIVVKATANDNSGTVTGTVAGVTLLVDGTAVGGEDLTSPYNTFSWNTLSVANGAHVLTARVRDAAGNIGTSPAISVTVNNDLTSPTATMTAPTGGTVSGSVTVTATATDNVGVSGVTFFVDGVQISTEDTSSPYSKSWSTTSSTNGSHMLTARARDAAGNLGTSIGVNVTVSNSDTTSPVAAITAPTGGTVLGSVTVTATATDFNGVSGVTLLVDGAAVGAEDTVAPYDSFTWNTLVASNGAHTLAVRARDAAGNIGTSPAINVTVNNDLTNPTVAISLPANGASVSGTVEVSATAADNVGVVGVSFFVDGAVVGTDASSPYSFSWDTSVLADGTHVLSAVANDAAGHSATSDPVGVTVFHPDVTEPTVAISAPLDGAAVSGTVEVSATATDAVGVAGVSFLVDGLAVGAEVTVAPYSFEWDTLSLGNGSHVLTAVATDAAGNSATSATVTVTIGNISPGSISIDPGFAASYSLAAAGPTISATRLGTGLVTFTSSAAVCTVSSTGDVSLVSAGTCTVGAHVDADTSYAAADAAEVTFAVILASRTLTIDPGSFGASYTMADPVPTISATPSVGTGVVSFSSSTPSVCNISYSSGLVSFAGAGTCTLGAEIDADSTYDHAVAAEISFDIFLATRTVLIDFDSFNASYSMIDSAPTITATASAGTGEFSFTGTTDSVCSVDSSTGLVAFVSVGTCTIAAEIATDGAFAAATSPAISLEITLATRTLTIDEASYATTYELTDTMPTITSTVSAGNGTKTYSSSTPLVCTIDPSTGLVGYAGAGTCTIGASIDADAPYQAAVAVTVSFAIIPASRNLNIDSGSFNASYAMIDTPPTVTSTASAGDSFGTKTYSSSNPVVCTVDTSTGLVAFAAPGTCTLGASIGADGAYGPADATEVSFEVTDPTTALGNRIANPSLETAGTGGNPANWLKDGYGTNTVLYTYPVAGQDGASGARIDVSAYTDGDAKWYFDSVPVAPGQSYAFSDYFKSTVPSTVLVQFRAADGTFSYLNLVQVGSSLAGWGRAQGTFTVPAGVTSLTAFHLISQVGSLVTDNFSLTQVSGADSTLPEVAISLPAADAAVTGTVTVAANASDDYGVASVTFYVDGVAAGEGDTSFPYSFDWDTLAAANGAHLLTAVARDAAGNFATSSPVGVSVSNSQARSLTIDAISYAATYSMTDTPPTISATASVGNGTKSYAGSSPSVCTVDSSTGLVGFVAPGTCTLGATITAGPAYDSATAPEISFEVIFSGRTLTINEGSFASSYTLAAVPPTITSTASLGNGTKTYSGTTPFVCSVDSSSGLVAFVASGTCTLGASIAANGAYGPAVATDVSFTVTDPAVALGNRIANPSLETIGTGGNPANWLKDGYGTNTVTFTYPVVGQDGASAARIDVSAYTDGDAKWYFDRVPVASGQSYSFSDYYMSTVPSSVLVQFRAADGTFTYQSLVQVGASSAGWSRAQGTFTVPTGVTSLTAFHLIAQVGTLVTDNFSLMLVNSPDTASPDVAISSPAAASVTGTVPVTAAATDNVGVTGVIFYVDGIAAGSEDTSFPYSFDWDTLVASNGAHSLTAVARDAAGNLGTSAAVSVIVSNIHDRTLTIDATSFALSYAMTALPPTLTSTASAGNGTKNYSSSTPGVCSVDSSSGLVAFIAPGTCTLRASIGADGSYNTATASGVSFEVTLSGRTLVIEPASFAVTYLTTDATPTITSTASVGNGTKTYSSSTPLVCSVGILSGKVAFVAAGTCALGASITASGAYGSATAPEVSFAVTNPAATANLIANPSLETAGTGGNPANWLRGGWGTNAATLTYPVAGQDAASAARVDITSFTDGDAKWYFGSVPVTPGQSYSFSDYYMSNVPSSVFARFTMPGGSFTYLNFLSGAASPAAWSRAQGTFLVPAGVTSLTVFHQISQVGYLVTDNFSLTPVDVVVIDPTPTGSNLIANPSLETAGAGGDPAGWLRGGWGTNAVTYAYPVAGQDGAKGARIDLTAFIDGDAKWYFGIVPVTPGQSYAFSDYYMSNVPSSVYAQFTMPGGSFTYLNFLSGAASPAAWSRAQGTFVVPAGVTSLTVFHQISQVGYLVTDNFSLTPVDGADSTLPEVAVSSPAAAAVVTGIVMVSATATDNVGVAGVTFYVDGLAAGAEDTSFPYSFDWNALAATNGAHSLTAVAHDAAGNSATSLAVAVTVTNPVIVAGNLITNGSLETADGTNPLGWIPQAWGTHVGVRTYPTIGHDGGKAATVQITAYPVGATGNSGWQHAEVPITPGTAYTFGSWVSSTAASTTLGRFTMADGSRRFFDLISPSAATPSWTFRSATFVAPAGAVSVTVLQLISSVGTLSVDDVSLVASANLIVNGSLETADGTNPMGWQPQAWGTHAGVRTYPSVGHDGGKAATVQITSYPVGATGNSGWQHAEVAVTPGTSYVFGSWFSSTAASTTLGRFTMADGSRQFFTAISPAAATPAWTFRSATFVAPAGAVSVTVLQLISSVGSLSVDDVSLVTGALPPI